MVLAFLCRSLRVKLRLSLKLILVMLILMLTLPNLLVGVEGVRDTLHWVGLAS